MSFSGGVYTLPGPALVTGEVVSATENNQFRNDVAGAFNVTMLRNGTSTATANLPMGGYKLTGLGVATTSGDALSYGQAAVISDFTASGTVTISSGTANGVAYLNGSKVLTTGSALTFDGTNLSANGIISSRDTVRVSDGTTTNLISIAGGGEGVIGTSTNHAVQFRVNNSEQMRLTSTGLGIGTSSPQTKLHVYGVSGGSILRLGGSGTSDWIHFGKDSTDNGYAYVPGAKKFSVYTNGSENLILDSSGNLGLGVTPSAWNTITVLQAKNASFGGYATYAYLNANTYYASGWKYIDSAAASRYEQSAGGHQWHIAPSGTAGNAISFTQAMTLDASGNLGVGYSTPSNFNAIQTAGQAYVFGPGTGSPAITLFGSSTGTGRVAFAKGLTGNDQYRGFIEYGYSSDYMAFITGASERMRIDSSGNVGIGTSSPDANSVTTYNKNLNVKSGSGLAYSINLHANATASGQLTLAQDADNSAFLLNRSNSYLWFGTNNTERMRIDSSGNLLVGTTSTFTVAGLGAKSYTYNNANAWISVCQNPNAGPFGVAVSYSGAAPNGTSSQFIWCEDNAAVRFNVRSNGGIANYSANNVNLSDRREKINFAPADSYLDKICSIPVQTFNYIDQNLEEDAGKTLGVVAQDVQAIAPELVSESNWGSEEEPKMRLSIYQTDFQYALMKCIQELKAELDATKAEVAALKV